jgi:tetratricopeptide (TPR) repeat protein
MQFLVAVYGAEKLNEPEQQEPILRKMIEMDPSDPSNYQYLANVYEQSGNYEEAEKLLLKSREMKPNDPSVYTALASFYNRQGIFDKTMEALHARAEKEPNNPEAYYTISTYYWDKAQKDFTIPQGEYTEALIYKGLLLRTQALLEKDPKVQQALVKEAEGYQQRAIKARDKQRAAGAE